MRRSETRVYIDDRRVTGRVPKRYMGPVRIETKLKDEDLRAQFPCPFCLTPLSVTGNCVCPDCESDFSLTSVGDDVVFMTTRNANNPTI